MNNLVIIGNGFDLAHGLKTNYSNFIEYLVNSKFENENLYLDLFSFNLNVIRYRIKSYNDIVINDKRIEVFESKNLFFKRISLKFIVLNWCDIEKEYFIELSNIGKDARYKTARELNSDFEIVKKYLQQYLMLEQSKFKEIYPFTEFFNKMDFNSTQILNFNYTDTVNRYLKSYSKSELVQIHGSLDNEQNPIIFGYAADNIESRKFLQNGDNEFMKNIKKHNYKRTQEENRLENYLNFKTNIEVSILGHSCGISDKLILNQIFNNKNVSRIRIYYHKNYEHYFETQVNLDRIMNNDNNFKKLINFQESLFIPQKDNTNHDIFSEKFDSLIKSNEEIEKKNGIQIF